MYNTYPEAVLFQGTVQELNVDYPLSLSLPPSLSASPALCVLSSSRIEPVGAWSPPPEAQHPHCGPCSTAVAHWVAARHFPGGQATAPFLLYEGGQYRHHLPRQSGPQRRHSQSAQRWGIGLWGYMQVKSEIQSLSWLFSIGLRFKQKTL